MKQLSTLALLFAAVSQFASADTGSTQSFSHTSTSPTDSFTLPSFDDRLGTLTAIGLTWNGGFTSALTTINPTGAPASATFSNTLTLIYPSGSDPTRSSTGVINFPVGYRYSFDFPIQSFRNPVGQYAQYVTHGPGTLNFGLSITAGIDATTSFGVTFVPSMSKVSVTTTVTYTFTPSSNPLTPQTITFAQPPDTSIKAGSLALTASSDSGLPVSFASKTTSTCTMSGASTVQLVAGGVCTIEATQAGNPIYAAATPVDQSFTIIPANFISVDYPGADGTVLTGINHYGQVTGYYVAGQHTHSFIYQIGAGSFTLIPDFAPDTLARGINDSGIIVGDGYVSGSTSTGHFLYNENSKTFTSLTVPATAGAIVSFGIDNQNDVVGYNGAHAFFESQGTAFSNVDYPGAANTGLQGVTSAAGVSPRSVGFYDDSSYARHGLLSVVGGVVSFDYPGATRTQGTGIYAQAPNSSIQIVGFYWDSGGHQHGFQYSGLSTFTTIDFPGATDTNVSGINDAGVVVGFYYGNALHGFVRTKP